MARLGSIAAAPFLGDQFVSLYVGATRVPTVPGKPTITGVVFNSANNYDAVSWEAPSSNGGSAITAYKLYADGVYDATAQIDLVSANSGALAGEYQVSAINAVGEGPLSEIFAVTGV